MEERAAVELDGMPGRSLLTRVSDGGRWVVSHGRRVLFCYEADDIGMRNMAVVAVTDAGVSGLEAAEVFGLSHEYVSRLRG